MLNFSQTSIADLQTPHRQNMSEETISLLRVEEWKEKYGRLKMSCFSSSDSMFCFGSEETCSLTIVETTSSFSATFILPSAPQIAILSTWNNLCAFGLASGVVGIIFDLDENHLSSHVHENVKLFDTLLSSKLTSIFPCNKERGFYVGNNLGIISKFACRGGEEVEVTRILELGSPVVQISLSRDDLVLVVSTEARTVICDNWKKTFREVGEKPRQGLHGGLLIANSSLVMCTRPGSRLWKADPEGKVVTTYQYKELLHGKQPVSFLDEDSAADSKFFTFNKTAKPFRNHVFTKLFELKETNYLVSFNKKLIYFFSANHSEVIFFFERRFGEIVDVCINGSYIFILGANATVLKYKIIIEETQPQCLMSDEMKYIGNHYFSSEEEDDGRISSLESLNMEDFSATASILSEEVSKRTRKLLGKASHRIKQTKSNLNGILDEMYADSLEQAKMSRIKETIISMTKNAMIDNHEKFLNLLFELDKSSLDSIFKNEELDLIRNCVNEVVKLRMRNELDFKLTTEDGDFEIAPAVAEILESIYSDNDNHLWDIDYELSTFIVKNSKVINPDELFEIVLPRFYCTWSTLVKKRLQTSSGSEVPLPSSNLTRISNLVFDLDLYSDSLSTASITPYQLINLILLKYDIEHSRKMVLYLPDQSSLENQTCAMIQTILSQMVVYFSHYPDEVALLDVLLSNKPLFNIFRDAFFRIRTNQNQVAKEQSIEKIGFLILQVFISKKIGAIYILEFCISTSFWPGFLHAISFFTDNEDIKWNYFATVLEHASLQNILDLGYLSSSIECNKLIDNLISIKPRKTSFTLEQVCYAMIKTIGVKNVKDILMTKSKLLPRRTFSARFYRHIIKMSLEEEEKIILQSNQGSNKFLSKVS